MGTKRSARVWSEPSTPPADGGLYQMSDDARSWLNFDNQADLAILFAGDPVLFKTNTPIFPVERDKHAPCEQGRRGPAGNCWSVTAAQKKKDLIDSYRINGEKLFNLNAQQ